jgi:hypothetical protein
MKVVAYFDVLSKHGLGMRDMGSRSVVGQLRVTCISLDIGGQKHRLQMAEQTGVYTQFVAFEFSVTPHFPIHLMYQLSTNFLLKKQYLWRHYLTPWRGDLEKLIQARPNLSLPLF